MQKYVLLKLSKVKYSLSLSPSLDLSLSLSLPFGIREITPNFGTYHWLVWCGWLHKPQTWPARGGSPSEGRWRRLHLPYTHDNADQTPHIPRRSPGYPRLHLGHLLHHRSSPPDWKKQKVIIYFSKKWNTYPVCVYYEHNKIIYTEF